MTDEIMEGQTSLFDQDIWFGKTSQERSQVTKAKTSAVSLKKPPKSSKKTPLFLDLQTENGHTPEASWEMGGALLGRYTMHSFGESPKEENESHLSQILEEEAPPEILFVRKGLSRDTEQSFKEGEGTSADSEGSLGESSEE